MSAASRLAVLSRQLTSGAAGDASAETLQRSATSAAAGAQDEQRPAPGGGRGTLTVMDNRTGKKYTVRLARSLCTVPDTHLAGQQHHTSRSCLAAACCSSPD